MLTALGPDDELVGPALVHPEDATVSFSSESISPEALPSEVIDATEFVEDAPPKTEPVEENLEGREYIREADHSGMKNQFLAAGGSKSDTPPPPTETNTASSLSDLQRRHILGRLKTEYNLELDGDNVPLALLLRIEGMVFSDTFPTNEDETRRTVKLLLTTLDPGEYAKSELFVGNLEPMKRALKAELEKRRTRPGKRRKGPPPLPPTH